MNQNSTVEIEIRKQFNELVQKYNGLVLCEDMPGQWVIRGDLQFQATFNGVTIGDLFSILIRIPRDYPNTPPSTEETGGRIPRDFHSHMDRSLCLGTPLLIRTKFFKDPRLLPFVEQQLIPFLYSFRHWQDYGKMPYGEFSHGGKGVLECYQELLQVADQVQIIAFVLLIATESYRGHLPCPCKSGIKIRGCHGSQLLELKSKQSTNDFLKDIENILLSFSEGELKKFKNIITKKILNKLIALRNVENLTEKAN